MLLSMNINPELIVGVVCFTLMIVLCVVLIINHIKNNRPNETGVPITIIVFMIISMVIFIRDPEAWFGDTKSVSKAMQESESKNVTGVRFTEEVYKTDKGNKVYVLTDTETGYQYMYYKDEILRLEQDKGGDSY